MPRAAKIKAQDQKRARVHPEWLSSGFLRRVRSAATWALNDTLHRHTPQANHGIHGIDRRASNMWVAMRNKRAKEGTLLSRTAHARERDTQGALHARSSTVSPGRGKALLGAMAHERTTTAFDNHSVQRGKTHKRKGSKAHTHQKQQEDERGRRSGFLRSCGFRFVVLCGLWCVRVCGKARQLDNSIAQHNVREQHAFLQPLTSFQVVKVSDKEGTRIRYRPPPAPNFFFFF